LTPTVAMLRETGFVDMVAEGLANFVVFHVVGNSVASLEEVKTITEASKGMKLFVVSNPLTAIRRRRARRSAGRSSSTCRS
jgi:hypothetical protein